MKFLLLQGGATSMGLLTHTGPPEWHPAPESVKQTCEEAATLCEHLGEDLVQVRVHLLVQNSHNSV
jgi:L-galactose dehydrogenase